MAQSFQHKICEVLVRNKVITDQEARDLQRDFKGRSKETFDEFLVNEGFTTRDEILVALAEYYEVPAFNVMGYMFDHHLLLQFPQDFLLRHGAIPLERDENMLAIIVSDPHNIDLLPELAEYVSDDIRLFVGLREDIIDAVMEFYEESPFTFDAERPGDESDESDELYEDEKLLEDIFKD